MILVTFSWRTGSCTRSTPRRLRRDAPSAASTLTATGYGAPVRAGRESGDGERIAGTVSVAVASDVRPELGTGLLSADKTRRDVAARVAFLLEAPPPAPDALRDVPLRSARADDLPTARACPPGSAKRPGRTQARVPRRTATAPTPMDLTLPSHATEW